MVKLNERAVLTQLNMSVWTARKYDKRVTREAIDAHKAADAAGRFNKALLPLCEPLEDVQSFGREVRRFFYENTLDWGIEGTRLLPTANYLDFMNDLRARKDDWQHLVRKFTRHYEDFVLEAKASLGTMFDPADYPLPEHIGSKFRINVTVLPVPSNDFRVDLPDSEVASIQEHVEARVQEAQELAMRDIWGRLHDVIRKAHDKLADPDAIFRDSLIDNVRELCKLLPKLNVTDDPELEQARLDAVAALGAYNPDTLRHNPELRSQKAAETKAIMDKMSMLFDAGQ